MRTVNVKEAAAIAGLSMVTVKRAIGIGNGNRDSYGHRRMPPLYAEKTQGRGSGMGSPSRIRISELRRWMRARERYNAFVSGGQFAAIKRTPGNSKPRRTHEKTHRLD